MASKLEKARPETPLFPGALGVSKAYLREAQLFVQDLRGLCPPLRLADVAGFTIDMALCDFVERFLPQNFEKAHLYTLMRFAVGTVILAEGRLSREVGLIPMLSMPDDLAGDKAVQWYLAWNEEETATVMRAFEKARRGQPLTSREHVLRIIAHNAPSPFKEISSAVSMVAKVKESLRIESNRAGSKAQDEEKRLRVEADIIEAINEEDPFKFLFKARDGITLGRRQVAHFLRKVHGEKEKAQSLDAAIAVGKDGKPLTLADVTPAPQGPSPLDVADRARLAREAREAYEERVRRARRPSAEGHVLDNLPALLIGELEPKQLAGQVGMDVSSINKALKNLTDEFLADPRFRAWSELAE